MFRFLQMRISFLLETEFLVRLPAWQAIPLDVGHRLGSCLQNYAVGSAPKQWNRLNSSR